MTPQLSLRGHSSSQAPYPSPRRKRQVSSIALLVLSKQQTLRWFAVWSQFCLARKHGTVEELPVKAPKKARTIEQRTVLVIQDGASTAIRKRPDTGLLAGLYELPNVEGHLTKMAALAQVKDMGLEPLRIEALPDAKHIFSHIEWRMCAYRIAVSSLEEAPREKFLFADKRESDKKYAIPSAFRAYTRYMKEENS